MVDILIYVFLCILAIGGIILTLLSFPGVWLIYIAIVILAFLGDFLIITDSVLNNDGYIDAILYNSEYQFVEYFGSISWRQNFIDLINEYFQTQLE